MLNNIIKNLVNKSLKNTSYGKIKVTYPDNSIFYFGKADDVAEIKFNSWNALFTCLSKGDIGLRLDVQNYLLVKILLNPAKRLKL